MEFKWPTEGGDGGGGVSTFLSVFTGQGSASISQSAGLYSVSGGILSFFVAMEITANGDGFADVEIELPGGKSLHTDAGSLIDLGTALTISGGNISLRGVIQPGSSPTTLKFGGLTPVLGADLVLGDTYTFRASVPVA